jgi:hypothetical protein
MFSSTFSIRTTKKAPLFYFMALAVILKCVDSYNEMFILAQQQHAKRQRIKNAYKNTFVK